MRSYRGFTLAESMLATVLVAYCANASVGLISTRIDSARVEQTKQDLARIQATVEAYRAVHHDLPGSLAELQPKIPLDPWGHPYEYVNFELSGTQGQRAFDGLPINSEYDLYSRGADGRSDANLRTDSGRDDIIRARDGSYIGLAADF